MHAFIWAVDSNYINSAVKDLLEQEQWRTVNLESTCPRSTLCCTFSYKLGTSLEMCSSGSVFTSEFLSTQSRESVEYPVHGQWGDDNRKPCVRAHSHEVIKWWRRNNDVPLVTSTTFVGPFGTLHTRRNECVVIIVQVIGI